MSDNLVIFGAGHRGKQILRQLLSPSFMAKNELFGVSKVVFYDNNMALQGTDIDGMPVITLGELMALDKDDTRIIIAIPNVNEALLQCHSLGFWRIRCAGNHLENFYIDPSAILCGDNPGDMSNLAYVHFESSDQWDDMPTNKRSLEIYEDLATMGKNEIAEKHPQFYERLENTVKHAVGQVLEIGCGNGIITRWLVENTRFSAGVGAYVVAVEKYSKALEYMKKYPFYNKEKIKLICSSLTELRFDKNERFDTILLGEIIEHISLYDELSFLETIRAHMAPGCRFICSTPIGYMADKAHMRGFNKSDFLAHLETYYGYIKHVYYTDVQQIAVGVCRA